MTPNTLESVIYIKETTLKEIEYEEQSNKNDNINKDGDVENSGDDGDGKPTSVDPGVEGICFGEKYALSVFLRCGNVQQ